VPVRAVDDMDGNVSFVLVVLAIGSVGGGSGRGVAVRGLEIWPKPHCSSILALEVWTVGRWDVDADIDVGMARLIGLGSSDVGRPGSATESLSIAFQSIQTSQCCDQVRQSCPRSVLLPCFCRKPLSVTTIIPLRQRVRATFIRGRELKNPACFVLTEDKIT
jgi:hypothetical protein